MFDATNPLRNLRIILWSHRKLYYIYDDPVLPDHEYDSLERTLKKIEYYFPEKLEESPTQYAGYSAPPSMEKEINWYADYLREKGKR